MNRSLHLHHCNFNSTLCLYLFDQSFNVETEIFYENFRLPFSWTGQDTFYSSYEESNDSTGLILLYFMYTFIFTT